MTKDEAASQVRMAYQLLLLREPEPQRLERASTSLQAGGTTLPALMQSLLKSREFALNHRKFARHYIAPERRELILGHSQFGEIATELKWLLANGARHSIIVDVGARGRDRSNSYDLLRYFGWRGILIEANPFLIDSIKKEFEGLDFDLVNAAACLADGPVDLYLGVNNDISSIKSGSVSAWGDIKGKVSVPGLTLSGMLRERDIPLDFDILSLDIEGMDVAVFKDLMITSDYRPRFLIIEIARSKDITDLEKVFSAQVAQAYQIYGHSKPNLFLARR